ncbi:MAG: HD domain-containing protein [Candidatus Woesearchaeota archaeon]
MNHEMIIDETKRFVRNWFRDAEGGHDWWHTFRVWRTARHIGEKEDANMLIVELGALLHDIADSKFHEGDESIGPRIAKDFLNTQGLSEETIREVVDIIINISFRKEDGESQKSPELKIVQDADRLDAIGAIGVARAFNYGGHKGREIYNPETKPKTSMSKEEYKKNNGPTINHFYDKLLRLKDMMNTRTGKSIAEHRHRFMEMFLNEFFKEWEGRL